MYFLYLLVLCHFTPEDNCQPIGYWQNELGSVVVIEDIKDHSIIGEYRSAVGVDGQIFPLIGMINQKENDPSLAISFTVQWKEYGSITSWSGFLDEDEEGCYIKTLWHLTRPGEAEQWERIIANSSTFRLINPIKE